MYRVRPMTPAFAAPYSVPRKSPSRTPIEAVFTIEPLLPSVISDSAACVVAMTLAD